MGKSLSHEPNTGKVLHGGSCVFSYHSLRVEGAPPQLGETQSADQPSESILVSFAPSRGCVLLLGETRSAVLSLGDPCYGPATAHPPGLGLSCPQPDANHLANWVRFLAPRSWACG